MSKIVTNSNKLVADLISLANQKSAYCNKYPYNCLHFDGDLWRADCLNLLKALFNGRDITDKSKGSYQHDLSNTGDCTESELIAQCTDVSTDFTKLSNVPEVLYMAGHVGMYLGKELTINGHIVNTVECTTAFGSGIVYSYVDSIGKRYAYKGGNQVCKWQKHGKATKWVEYIQTKAESCPYAEPTSTLYKNCPKGDGVRWLQWHLVKLGFLAEKYDGIHDSIDGSFGNATDVAFAKFQNQYPQTGTYNKYTNRYEPDGRCGNGSRAKLKELVNNTLPKKVCPYAEPTKALHIGDKGEDVKWLQYHLVELGFLAEKYDGIHDSIDGSFGNATEKALNSFQEKYPECGTNGKPDGSCGGMTRAKLKALL